MAKALAGNDQITLLVNNAGTSFVGPLDGATVDQLRTLVNINIVALTRLAMAVLPGFKSRNHGAIVNLGSAVGFDGYPYTPIYGATKAYVQNLTRALQAELAGTNVVVQLVTPAATVSELWGGLRFRALEHRPKARYVHRGPGGRSACRAGAQGKSDSTIPYKMKQP